MVDIPPKDSSSFARTLLNLLLVVLLLYLFLVGVESLSKGIKGLGGGRMDDLMGQVANPFLSLLVGILATTLVQSSSVTTSLIVSMVGSGQLPVSAAVPMIMGANIGTTVTNTIASMASVGRRVEFERAFGAATCHDFFNFLAVVTLLPFELITRAIWDRGVIEMTAGAVARLTVGTTTGELGTYKSPLKSAIKWGHGIVKDLASGITTDKQALSILLGIMGVVIIFITLYMIVRTMRGLVLSKIERYVNKFIGTGGPIGIVVGIVLTVMVQSSSITTSVLVPLAGAGLITIRQIYPITLGANIGTTITALIASLAVSGSGDEIFAARQIAFVHLTFNLLGIAIFYVPPGLRRIPIMAAERFARYASGSRRWAVVYVFTVFYVLPAAIFFVSRQF